MQRNILDDYYSRLAEDFESEFDFFPTTPVKVKAEKEDILTSFLKHVQNSPDNIAVICGNHTITYQKFNENVNQLANELINIHFDLLDDVAEPYSSSC